MAQREKHSHGLDWTLAASVSKYLQGRDRSIANHRARECEDRIPGFAVARITAPRMTQCEALQDMLESENQGISALSTI